MSRARTVTCWVLVVLGVSFVVGGLYPRYDGASLFIGGVLLLVGAVGLRD